MVNTLSGSVCAYRKETVKPRFIRIDEVMALLDVTQDEAMDIALAAGARYQLAKIILVHKERLMKFMKHSARVPSSNKIVEKKFVRIGEGSMTYSIGHHRFIEMAKDEWYRQLFERLDNSKFRSSFHLKQKDIDYINEKGLDTIRQHAADFIAKREAPAYIANDGKQTPMRGHPVFIAQHATATCCRECIRKWHKMQPGKELSQVQQDYLVDVIMTWIQKEIERQEHKI